MSKDKVKLGIFETSLLLVLLILFLNISNLNYYLIAGVLVGFTIIARAMVRKLKKVSLRQNEVKVFMGLMAVLYVAIFFGIGAIINDFSNQMNTFSWYTLTQHIIPLTCIIISAEILREHFINAELIVRVKGKEYNLSTVLMFIATLIIDIIVYARVYDINNYDEFLIILGFIAFASVSNNLFYNYITRRYGAGPNIIYRLITTLYIYIIPIAPNLYVYFRSILRMVVPFILWILVEKIFSPREVAVSQKMSRKSTVGICVTMAIIAAIAGLVSCKFKYGAMVIATESMTGAINKGDVVLFEAYDEQEITKGQIILFDKNGLTLVHRVVKIEEGKDGKHYITKGDANENNDAGYVTESDLVGVALMKMDYVGWPTLWLRGAFNG